MDSVLSQANTELYKRLDSMANSFEETFQSNVSRLTQNRPNEFGMPVRKGEVQYNVSTDALKDYEASEVFSMANVSPANKKYYPSSMIQSNLNETSVFDHYDYDFDFSDRPSMLPIGNDGDDD